MKNNPPYSTLLLEDETPTRDFLSACISIHEDLELIGSAETCAQAMELLKTQKPDVLVADLGLPDGNGVDVIRHAKALHPDIEILVVSMFGDEENVVAALEAGASGYLLKKQAFDELGEAILCLMRGESAISPEVARYLLKRFNKGSAEAVETSVNKVTKTDKFNPLTAREKEVLGLIAKGYSYDEIAEAFSLSTNTIRAHIRNIYRKLSVRSRSEAVFEAAHMGIIDFA
ncbi:MAG: response regulator transcription factor [Mariprofundaceae bacterium]|nr:response regulator transcription factor [Mariprofundaceae bacterium]